MLAGIDERVAAATVALRRELPCGVDDVQYEDRVGEQLHEGDVGKPVDDEFPCAGYPLAFPDSLEERRQALDLFDDAPFHHFRCARASLGLAGNEDLLEVVEGLGGPDDPHAYAGLCDNLAARRPLRSAIASSCSWSPVLPASARARVLVTFPNSQSS